MWDPGLRPGQAAKRPHSAKVLRALQSAEKSQNAWAKVEERPFRGALGSRRASGFSPGGIPPGKSAPDALLRAFPDFCRRRIRREDIRSHGVHHIRVFIPEKWPAFFKLREIRLKDYHSRNHPPGNERVVRTIVPVRNQLRLRTHRRHVRRRMPPQNVIQAIECVVASDNFRERLVQQIHLRREVRDLPRSHVAIDMGT